MNIVRAKPTLTYPLTDKQVVFDYVYHHFIVEKNPFGVNEDKAFPQCVYDTPSGGCAVGCLLPSELRKRIGNAAFGIQSLRAYNQGAEIEKHRSSGYQLFLPFAQDLVSTFSPDIVTFLHDMQIQHDCAAKNAVEFRAENLNERLIKLAKDNNLSLPVN